jgi:hypothetical protein
VTATPRHSRAFVVAAAALVVVVAFVHVVRLPEPLGVDQGLFADFARWVPRGWLPYRDIFDGKPPLFLYWWAASALVPGGVVHAAWWWEGIWLAATLGVTCALGSKLWGPWVGLAAAALVFAGMWSPAWGDHGQPFWARAQAEEVLALPMLASAWMAWRALDRPRMSFWAGVFVGVCGLVKIPSMAIALSWTVAWIACTPARDAARRTGMMAAGALVPWGLAFAWFAAHGATSSFVEGVFVYPRYSAAFIAPPWGGVFEQYGTKMLTEAPLLVLAAAVGVVRLARKGAREVHWVGAWIVATMGAVVMQRQLVGTHYMLTVPALAMAGAYGIVDTARAVGDRASRLVPIAGLTGLALFALNEVAHWWRAYAPDLACLTGRLSRDEYLRAIQAGTFSMANEEDAAAWVREHSAPADGILVWGLSPGIYALADRHPVTRFPRHKILLTDAPLSRMWPGLDGRRAELIQGLESDPPIFILVGQSDQNELEPLDSQASLMRFRDLRALLQRGYATDGQIGRFLVARRTAAP